MPGNGRPQIEEPATFTAIDLFSGCGGLTEGLKQAKFKVIGAIERDALAAETYRTNHPAVVLLQKDIRRVSAAKLMRQLHLKKGTLDLLAGCPPCQGFSTLTTLNGSRALADNRNDLVYQFLRFVRKLRPKAIMMENVPALAKDVRMLVLSENLKRLGYECRVEILDAADYAVPQRRRRMILLGGLDGQPSPAPVARCRRTVSQAIRSLPRPTRSRDKLHYREPTRSLNVQNLIRLIPKNGGSRSSLPEHLQLQCHKRCDGFKDIYGRMAWNSVAPTITSGCINPSKGRFLHPRQNRAITLREAALLQTFPKRYSFSMKRGRFAVALMIGNALPPEFIRRHACALRRFLSD